MAKAKGQKPKPIIHGAELQGIVSDDPTGLKRALQGPIDTVTETGRALKEASDQLKSAAAKVESILDSEHGRISEVLDNAAESLKGIRNVLGDKETQQQLSAAMKRLPQTLDNMSETFQSADASLKAFTRRSETDGKSAVERMVETIEMTERTLRRFSESPEPGKAPPAEQIAQAVENIGEITAVLRSVVERIDRGEGSLGALLNDRQLYDRLNRAARNIEQVSRDLKPIVADARVFSDKVARHPGVIIRDAVKPGVGIK
jgi:phospholipid/cholesterol/gamma-HCH transport system substrate-binding protein